MTIEKAVLAGGCFWGLEDLFKKLPGVTATEVGYTGGDTENATYRNHGDHAEAVQIEYDSTRLSYKDILYFFFQVHDPTTKNRQGNDVGRSYRSAIFYLGASEKLEVEEVIADLEKSGKWPGPFVTEVVKAKTFWPAEPEHQDYLEHNPYGYTCHYIRPNWVLD